MIGRLLRNLLGCNQQTFQPSTRADFNPCCMAGVAPPSRSERQHQAWAQDYLRMHGSITLRDIRLRGCNSPSKVVFRLRALGVVLPKHTDKMETNANGNGQHKRYFANPKWRAL